MVINKLVIKRAQVTTVQKKTLILSPSYLEDVSLQTRTKLTKSFKGNFNCCKLQIVFINQRRLANVFRFKDRLPFDWVSTVVYKYTCGKCNSSYFRETIGTWKLGLQNIFGYHSWYLENLSHQKRVQFATISYIAIISHSLMSLPSWHMDIIRIILKSKKACLLSVV